MQIDFQIMQEGSSDFDADQRGTKEWESIARSASFRSPELSWTQHMQWTVIGKIYTPDRPEPRNPPALKSALNFP